MRQAGNLTRAIALTFALLIVVSTALGAGVAPREFDNLRAAIVDLRETFGDDYPGADDYLAQLKALPKSSRQAFDRLQREALLANPLLTRGSLLMVRRRVTNPSKYITLGLPTNHECNTSLKRNGHDAEIARLSPITPVGKVTTVFKPKDGGFVGELDLHWDAGRLLFTRSDATNWKIWEVGVDGKGLRQVSRAPKDVDSMDACYAPGDRVLFGSTASYQSVPCWHGQRRVSNLYSMNGDGGEMRQLCFDQDHDFHPAMLSSGQVIYHRWDYSAVNHIFMRQLMTMNPDGSTQRAIYGSNSWFPNSLYFPREIPGDDGRLVCILSGYHGPQRMGQLVIVDPNRGWHEADGLVQRISGRGDPITPKVMDHLVKDDWPKFLHPYPISERHFLVSCWPNAKASWGLYLADVFDNVVPIRVEKGYALLEPTLIAKRPAPAPTVDRSDAARDDAVVFLQDVYAGPGLDGVPRGVVTGLRVFAYDYGYPGMAGPDKIGRGGPWEAITLLGTVSLEDDGSAMFRVPANTPLSFQALDKQGRAVQLMRSWFTAAPGETTSCVGCHETPAETPAPRQTLAARAKPVEITPWRGPARGFDFEREVQPVLDRHCVGCHDGAKKDRPDLRGEGLRPDYKGSRLSDLGVKRLHPEMARETGELHRYTPAYEELIKYIRRPNVEDDVSLLAAGEYHVDSSELIQMLSKGHHGARLDDEAWDRLVTWIDLNAPCHGSWLDARSVPDSLDKRRAELRALYGGPVVDANAQPVGYKGRASREKRVGKTKTTNVTAPGWPFGAEEARRRQASGGAREMSIDLGEGVSMTLARIPAGEFVMGDAKGRGDEQPMTRVEIREPFWMGVHEVTNEQFRRFDPSHDSGYFAKRHERADDKGPSLNGDKQPAVRVSWERAMAYCEWLSKQTGRRVTLPTEAQWEYAARAGSARPLHYGGLDDDFTPWANLADHSFSIDIQVTGGIGHLVLEGAALADSRFNDGALVTEAVGSRRPNAWGLFDTAGNVAEWTRSAYRSYPFDDNGTTAEGGLRVVRGGSFADRPDRGRSGFRTPYPAWRRLGATGFRVIVLDDDAQQLALQRN